MEHAQSTRIRAVAFDMDQTLVNLEHVHDHATRRLYLQRGIDYRRLDDEANFQGWRVVDYLAALCKRDGVNDHVPTLVEERARYFCEALPAKKVDLLPGAREALAHLVGNYSLALVTGTDRACVDAVLSHYALDEHFHVVVTGEETPRGKPDPAPYLLAAERLGVQPHEMVVVEDSEAGVRSGRAAGARVIGVPFLNGSQLHDLSHAHVHARTLHDVPRLVTTFDS